MKNILILAIAILFFNGCTDQPNTNSKIIQENKAGQKQPLWINDPQKEAEGKTTSVGCASRHINGITAQKKLALQRAIDEIAMQKLTKVQTITYNTKSISQNDKNSRIETASLQETKNTDVSVKIMEYYENFDGDICVWIIEN